MKISAVVLTKNEENNIGKCLGGLEWCDEVIIVDDYSTDNTVEIARKRGAKVYKRHLEGNFAKQRNFGLKKARGDWVLFLDADERLSPALYKEIVRRLKKAKKSNIVGFYFKRKDFFINKWLNHGETAHVKLLRLAQKNSGAWKGKVHEVWGVKGKTALMDNPLLHYPHGNIAAILKKTNFYTSLRAKELHGKEVKANFLQIIAYPLAKFIKNYFWHQGLRDGSPGAVFALLMTLHSFLVRAKLWELNKK